MTHARFDLGSAHDLLAGGGNHSKEPKFNNLLHTVLRSLILRVVVRWHHTYPYSASDNLTER